MNRIKDVIYYSFKSCGNLAMKTGKNKIILFIDMVYSYLKYGIWTNQYIDIRFYDISAQERKYVAESLSLLNKEIDRQHDFIKRYETTPLKGFSRKRQLKRIKAFYEFISSNSSNVVGRGLRIGRNSIIVRDHISLPLSKIVIGENFKVYDNVYIDFSGDLVIGNNVSVSQGAMIYTHDHDMTVKTINCDWSVPSPMIRSSLTIGDGVWIGARAIILADCKNIGRGAIIGSGSVIRSSIPPYAIVTGNPAKIVGFRLTPQEIIEFEAITYTPEIRLDRDTVDKNFKKHFQNRIKDIREYLR